MKKTLQPSPFVRKRDHLIEQIIFATKRAYPANMLKLAEALEATNPLLTGEPEEDFIDDLAGYLLYTHYRTTRILPSILEDIFHDLRLYDDTARQGTSTYIADGYRKYNDLFSKWIPKMLGGRWSIIMDYGNGTVSSGILCTNRQDAEDDAVMAKAMTAVNNTYAKGINPEAVSALYNGCEAALDYLGAKYPKEAQILFDLQQAIEKAKL